MTENTKLYELGFHIIPTAGADKAAEVFSVITKIINEKEGAVLKTSEPKAMKLAYTIVTKIAAKNETFKETFFAWIKFTATSENIEEIKVEIASNEDVIRYIIVKTVDDEEHSTTKLVTEKETEEELNAEGNEEVKVTSEESEKEAKTETKKEAKADTTEEKVEEAKAETEEEVKVETKEEAKEAKKAAKEAKKEAKKAKKEEKTSEETPAEEVVEAEEKTDEVDGDELDKAIDELVEEK